MLCLVCSDFPRAMMIEAAKAVPVAGKAAEISMKQGADLLFEQYDL